MDELLSHLPSATASDVAIRIHAMAILSQMSDNIELLKSLSRSGSVEFWVNVVELRPFGYRLRRSLSMINGYVHYNEVRVALTRMG